MEKYDTKPFEKNMENIGIFLNEKQITQFLQYYELLIEWNSFMNLTAITDFDEVINKHFMDSLLLIKAYDLNQKKKDGSNLSIIDVGTGAGFPGIPLKIAFPELNITLLDSLGKRIKFLNEVVERLNLHGVKLIHGRAEDYAKPGLLREKFDLCVSRAVANLSTLAEYCLPFVKKEGSFISYKSEKLSEEMEASKKAIQLFGGKIEEKIEYTIPSTDIYRNLLVIKKIKATPAIYPRKAGLPGKEPIL